MEIGSEASEIASSGVQSSELRLFSNSGLSGAQRAALSGTLICEPVGGEASGNDQDTGDEHGWPETDQVPDEYTFLLKHWYYYKYL